MTPVDNSRRVLLICNDTIGPNMAGPGIRYWEFARVLSHYFSVTLAIPPSVKQGSVPTASFPVTLKRCQNEAELAALVNQTEVMVTVGTILAAHPSLLKMNKPLGLDIYIPLLTEILELYVEAEPTSENLFFLERGRNALNTQLRAADFMICASEKQRDYWLGMLSALGRVNPYTYSQDKTLRRLIDVVPFGLPKEKAIHTKQVLKGVYKNIELDDYVLIWTGGIWEWLDAPTLIKAMPLVLQKQPKVKLFFMGTKRPNRTTSEMEAANQAIALSQKLGLYDRYIFFNDWVAYDERQNYLLEADLGVSLHLNHLENRFSFRTRFLDHLWTGLPLLATEGDQMSAELEQIGLGRTVKAGEVEAVAQAIMEMLDHKKCRQSYQAKLEEAVATYQWENVVKPLVEFCAQPHFAPDKPYLRTTPVVEIGPTPYWRLPGKAWQALKKSGVAGLLWQLKRYILWKQGHWANE